MQFVGRFARDGTKQSGNTGGEYGTSAAMHRTPGPSCNALRHAISNLYRLDDFDMEALGSGFFSTVYKVVHKVSGQVMVLKMNKVLANRPNVLREVQMMNRISHPNVLRFIGVCVHDGRLDALVEFVNGGSLEELIAEKTRVLPWPMRIKLACDVAKGVKYLHSKGIMHRDLTSKNILIKKEPEGRLVAIVADLGLASNIPDPLSVKPLPIVGSPYWMAPECIVGKTQYNEKTDVFSYGIVLCELIARVEADPDVLPRTKKFGVDYVAFSKMAADCPLHFLHLAFICCQIEPTRRPSFIEVVQSLEEMKSSAQMAVILAEVSRLQNTSGARVILNRMLLEQILRMAPRKARSEELAPSIASDVTDSADTTSTFFPPKRQFIPVTPVIVGKIMSEEDKHYSPQKGNPFPAQYRNAVTKVTGGLFDCEDKMEMQSPTPMSPYDSSWCPEVGQFRRRSHSLPGTPLFINKSSFNFGVNYTQTNEAHKACSVASSTRKLETEDVLDNRSEGGSSFDSALGLDVISKDGDTSVVRNRRQSQFCRNTFRSSSLMCSNSDMEIMAYLFPMMGQAATVNHVQIIDGSDFNKSCSSSGSQFSYAESLSMTPTSSFSSHSASDAEVDLPRSVTQRLLSQEQFQRLMQCWEDLCQNTDARLSQSQSVITQTKSQIMLPQQLEHSNFDLLRKFQDLKQRWENQQHTSNLT